MGAFADVPMGRKMGTDVPDTMPPANQGRPRYELLRVVNRGGMGEIALAKAIGTKGFEKLVVLKRLRADAEREDHLAMFDVEQEVMSKIEHPNIVKVFDQPVVDDVPYMAMEYVRGRNLDQVVRAANQSGQVLPYQFCLSIIGEVLRGLAFVHRLKDAEGRALGVVHQDMTPSNVMVSFFGEVKITDFGISYVTSRDGGLRRGVLKGKPRYVAPEVLAGKRVNNTADIYGVGVVLFEMLTGRALFARPSVKETLSAVARNELPDLQEELQSFGPGLVNLMDRALQKDPQARYRTAEEMGADVINELATVGGPMPAASLGFLTRNFFPNDPDVPEMDPTLEQAIHHGGAAVRPELKPKDLDSTLIELDKLLGKDDSVDLFSVPDELLPDLRELPDMDPFQAHTPLPEFMWDAKSEAEILEKASTLLPSAPPPLYGSEPGRSGGLTKKEMPPFMPDGLDYQARTESEIPTERPADARSPSGDKWPTFTEAKATSEDLTTETPPPQELKLPLEPNRQPPSTVPVPPMAEPAPTAEPVSAGPRSSSRHGQYTPETLRARPTDPLPEPMPNSGMLIGFALGLAVGLAAGALLYAALL